MTVLWHFKKIFADSNMTGGAILQVFPGGGAILQVIPYQIDIEQIRAVEGRKHRYLNPILTKGKGTPRGADSAHHRRGCS